MCIFMLWKPIPTRFATIFFYNFLVHLYCFKLRVGFFVISVRPVSNVKLAQL